MTALSVELQHPPQRRRRVRVAEGRFGQQPSAERLGLGLDPLRGAPRPCRARRPRAAAPAAGRASRPAGCAPRPAAPRRRRRSRSPLAGAPPRRADRRRSRAPARGARGRGREPGRWPVVPITSLEHLARPAAVARLERAGGGVRDPAPGLGELPRRREVRRALEQLGRRRRRAARLGSSAGVVERARDGLVRAGRGEGEVPRALLGLAHSLGDRGVQRAARRRVRRGVGAGGEQRVSEGDHAVADVDDLRALGIGEHVVAGDGVHHGQGRLAHRRRHREAAAGGG